MLERLARKARRLVLQISAGARFQLACLFTRTVLRKQPLKLLLVSDQAVYTSEQQFAPFRRFAAALRGSLGLVTRSLSVERATAMRPGQLAAYDIIGLKFSFRANEAAALALARRIRQAIAGQATRLVYFDGDDDINILWPELVAITDLYVKKHIYRDRSQYGVVRRGKSNLTDWVAREYGRSFDENEIPRSRPLDPGLASRVWAGWNIGLDDKIADLARRVPAPAAEPRPIDVCSRAVVADDAWIFPLRNPVVRQLECMSASMAVLVPRERVSQERYYDEMRSAKICVSPFGYGEICWRDFEAILLGCLLVKPDMAHVETAPDIFIPGVTYAPVKWDYSDLPQVCAHYLEDEARRRQMVEQAYAAVMASQRPDWFVRRIETLLERA